MSDIDWNAGTWTTAPAHVQVSDAGYVRSALHSPNRRAMTETTSSGCTV